MNKVYLKYYFSSLFKNKMGITIFILLSASGLALNSIIGSGEEMNYTLVFILPSICWVVLSTLLFAIELYGKTKANGMELMFAGMPISRRKNVVLKNFTSFSVAFISSVVLISITSIPLLIRVQDFKMIIFMWLTFILSSILIIFFCTSIFTLICSYFSVISSIIISIIISFFLIFGAIGVRLMFDSENHNKMSWNDKNGVNYASMFKVNPNGKVEEKYKVFEETDRKIFNNNKGDDVLNYDNKLNSWLNPGEWIVNPISSIFGRYHKTDKESLIISSQDSYKFSMSKIINKKSGEISELPIPSDKQKWVFVSAQDFNPFTSTKEEIIEKLVDLSKGFKKEFSDSALSDDNNFGIWVSRLKTEPLWKRLNLTEEDKNILRYWTGLYNNEHLNFYLLNYFNLLKNKVLDFESILKEKGVPKEHIELLDFLFKSDIARDNILDKNALVSAIYINDKFPFLNYKNVYSKANYENIEQIKDLVRFQAGNNLSKIILEDGSTFDVDLSKISTEFKNIKNKNEWNDYIDAHNEYGNLEKIYKQFKSYLNNNGKNIKVITFSNNIFDVYKIDGYYNVKVVPFSQTHGITSLIIFMIGTLSFITLLKTYKNKNIS